MVYIKLLSGDIITIDGSHKVSEMKDRMRSPCCIFFLDDRVLEDDEKVPEESVVSVLFEPYRLFFLWMGCNNSVWPGEFDTIYCFDYSLMEMIEWYPDMVSKNDIVAADYLSFGLYHPYFDMIREMLHIDYNPIDIDKATLDEILIGWRAKAMGDTRKLTFTDFMKEYMGYMIQKYEVLFRVREGIVMTPLEWLERVTMRR
jgi:hypothetical protein